MITDQNVTAAELVRHFARYRKASDTAPVRLTHHGRRTHVLLSEEQYQDLVASGGSTVPLSASGAREFDLLCDLADWIDEALILCGPDLDVRFANRVALAICCRRTRPLPLGSLFELLPDMAGSLMEIHVRRTMIGGEPCSADIPSPFKDGAWLRFQSFPLGDNIVLKFRDITDDVRSRQLANVKAAMLQGMGVHGGIGYVRVSLQGMIDQVEDALCDLLALPADRLRGVAIGDLVEISQRDRFRKAFDAVVRGSGPQRLSIPLRSNRGDIVHMDASIVQVHGAYAAEGVVILMTPDQSGMSVRAIA